MWMGSLYMFWSMVTAYLAYDQIQLSNLITTYTFNNHLFFHEINFYDSCFTQELRTILTKICPL